MAQQKKKTVYLTKEALEKLREEVHHLRTAGRARIADAIAEARSHGDLSENAEYDAAKEEQGKLEARIAKLEETIGNARIIDESQIDTSKAYILSTVRVKNHKFGTEQHFTLVSEQEADLSQNKISITSPIGKGLLGREVGDVIEIKVPAGKVKLEILEITRRG
jgi:transcription elongation factor GreA